MRLPAPHLVPIAAALLAAGFAQGRPAAASNASDLKNPYFGTTYSIKSISDTSSNPATFIPGTGGKLTGVLGSFPLTGKITNTGKITFTVSGTYNGGSFKVKNGKGQLSADGNYILGTLTIQATGFLAAANGPHIFSFPSQNLLPNLQANGLRLSPAGSDLHAAARAPLHASYDGLFHDNVNKALDAKAIPLTGLTVGSGGKFTATLAGVPIKGKMTSKGKVTFSGKLTDGGDSIEYKAKGQANFITNVIIGTMTIKGKGIDADQSGKGTFELKDLGP
jgi:hypothetical protein